MATRATTVGATGSSTATYNIMGIMMTILQHQGADYHYHYSKYGVLQCTGYCTNIISVYGWTYFFILTVHNIIGPPEDLGYVWGMLKKGWSKAQHLRSRIHWAVAHSIFSVSHYRAVAYVPHLAVRNCHRSTHITPRMASDHPSENACRFTAPPVKKPLSYSAFNIFCTLVACSRT